MALPARDLFDIPEDVAYLNCAFQGPLSRSSLAAGQAALAAKAQPWTIGPDAWFGPLQHARELLAGLLGGDADGVALTPATSYGIATAAANVVVDPIKDRHGRNILTVRDQNTFAEKLRQKRLMDVIHLWLIHRFKPEIVYYVTPTEDNIYQTEKMKSHGIFSNVYQEVGEIIVADVNQQRIDELLASDRAALKRLIAKED